MSLLIYGPGAAEKVDDKTFVVRKDKCGSGENSRCQTSTDTLSITGKCTAQRRIDERSYWKSNNYDDKADFTISILKYDFSKAAQFEAVELPNKKGTKSVFFVFSGDKGAFCIGSDHVFGKRASEPTLFDCWPSPIPGLGGLVDLPFLGEGPAIAERGRKAATYYRTNSCAGKPF